MHEHPEQGEYDVGDIDKNAALVFMKKNTRNLFLDRLEVGFMTEWNVVSKPLTYTLVQGCTTCGHQRPSILPAKPKISDIHIA